MFPLYSDISYLLSMFMMYSPGISPSSIFPHVFRKLGNPASLIQTIKCSFSISSHCTSCQVLFRGGFYMFLNLYILSFDQAMFCQFMLTILAVLLKSLRYSVQLSLKKLRAINPQGMAGQLPLSNFPLTLLMFSPMSLTFRIGSQSEVKLGISRYAPVSQSKDLDLTQLRWF